MRHEAATFRREAYERHQANWDAIPDDLKALLSERADYMNEQMKKFDHDMIDFDLEMLENKEIDPITLPPGMTRAEAAEQIYKNDLSDELEKALGDNAETLAKAAGRLADRGGMYWPVSRSGPWYISGRRKIATAESRARPCRARRRHAEGTRELQLRLHRHQGRPQLSGRHGGERRGAAAWVSSTATSTRSPATASKRPTMAASTVRDWEAEPRYYVEVQHRFMAMGETVKELEELKEAMESGPDASEYEWLSEPLAMGVNHTPDRQMIPSQLASFHRNIDSMKGHTDAQKATLKSMATNVFVRTQQGNRLTKKMLRRAGVAGYETKQLDNLLATLHSNNEMMSRHSVNRRRMAAIEKARDDAKAFVLAAAGRGGIRDPEALAKVPEHLRPLITRTTARGDGQPSFPKTGKSSRSVTGHCSTRARYGSSPSAGAMRCSRSSCRPIWRRRCTTSSTPWASGCSRSRASPARLGLSAALRYSSRAEAYMSGMGNKYAGFSEAVQEGKDFVTGFHACAPVSSIRAASASSATSSKKP